MKKNNFLLNTVIIISCLIVLYLPAISYGASRADIKKELADCRQHHQAYIDDLMLRARQIARQCKNYLDHHPLLKPEEFGLDPDFQPIAVQTVGRTGASFLMECGHKDQDVEQLSIYADAQCYPLPQTLRSFLQTAGTYAHDYKAILKATSGCKEAAGFYIWNDGIEGVKAMALAPVSGYPYMIGCHIYALEYKENKGTSSIAAATSKPDKTKLLHKKIKAGYFGIRFGCNPETVRKTLKSAMPSLRFTPKKQFENSILYSCQGNPVIKHAKETTFFFWKDRLYEIVVEFTDTPDQTKKIIDNQRKIIEEKYGKMSRQFYP
ncbi:MAG: hypothetical protein GXP53_02595, partial [Deltaproteobacteria bacterium]|nr:hypothetical protein [Deltaproteobacteria bacterium]